MAKFYPSLKNIKNSHIHYEEGEIYFLEKLSEYLNDEYEVYFQSQFNGSLPDVIIMRPDRMVMIVEIKDWKLNSYYKIGEKDQWQVRKDNVYYNIKSPFKQANYYKENLVNYYTSLFEKRIKDKKTYGFIKEFVYFHNETNSSFENFLRKNNCTLELNEKVLTRDILEKKELFLLELEKFYIGEKKTKYFLEDVYSELRLLLTPAKHLKENGVEISYNKEQKRFIESKVGEYKIKGVVGSGKTTVLAKRAVNAHKRHGNQVLILYFNITVGNYIHDKISKVREDFYWQNFEIKHFHSFIYNEKNRIGNDKNIKNITVDEIFESIKNYSKVKKYKTIIVDEVQDFEKKWINLLKSIYLDEDGEFVVFGDEKQNIYKKANIENKELSVPIKGSWGKLNYSYRLPEKMVQLAEAFQKNFFYKSYNCDQFEMRQMSFDFEEFKFEYSFLPEKFKEEIAPDDLYKEIIKHLKDNNIKLEDICILTKGTGYLEDSKNFILKFQDYMIKKGITPNSVFEKLSDKKIIENKVIKNTEKIEEIEKEIIKKEISQIRKSLKFNFRMGKPNIKICTVHSFKGWEADTIIYFIFNENYTPEEVYTAITRAKRNLIIFNLGDVEYDTFFKKYIETELIL